MFWLALSSSPSSSDCQESEHSGQRLLVSVWYLLAHRADWATDHALQCSLPPKIIGQRLVVAVQQSNLVSLGLDQAQERGLACFVGRARFFHVAAGGG